MKTLAEFIQRLQDDPAFEKEAQAFNHGDDLRAFLKRQGYDFTLEQLMCEFERGEKLPAESSDPAPAPADVSPPPPSGPDEAEFTRQPEDFSRRESGADLPEIENNEFTRSQPPEGLTQPQEALPPRAPAEQPRGGVFKGSGGRHRGFSPQRLKSVSEEDP